MDFINLKDLIDKTRLATFLEQCKNIFADKTTVSTISNSLETHSNDDDIHVTAELQAKWNDACEVKPYIRIKSCTPGSTKIFRLTIDDTGVLTGEEEDSITTE